MQINRRKSLACADFEYLKTTLGAIK